MILLAMVTLIDLAIIVGSILTIPADRLLIDLLLFVLIMGPVLALGAMRVAKHVEPVDHDELVGGRR